ncbi:MAG TPA: hypothetical protein DD735_01540 [Clostridiales bacterium]|nr:hypothetical protein [Clostridiales bacterium]
MKKAWRIVLILTLSVLALGGICFALSLILGADLVRISDAVFARYDLAQTILNVQNLIFKIKTIF